MTAPNRAELVEHLVATRICGDVATPRQNNLGNARRCADRDPGYTFGLTFTGRWSYPDVVALMAERVGISPDLSYTAGQDRIDPSLCVDRLDAMAGRLARAGTDRERVILATGHPGGLLGVHLAVADRLRALGCTLLEPAEGSGFVENGAPMDLRYIGGVAMASRGAGLAHTHSPQPMRHMLAVLAAAGEAAPSLVVGDHGWAGAAGQAGIDAVGYADCNDPALFVGEAEGRVVAAVPLDDGVLPHAYRPLIDYLLSRLP